MTHIFRNSISGDVLGSYQGSHTETVEAIAEAAGMNIKLHDIVERDEDETSLVRKNPLSLLENKHPRARKMRMCHGCEIHTSDKIALALRVRLPCPAFSSPPTRVRSFEVNVVCFCSGPHCRNRRKDL